jgi:hypothetical protein
MRPKLGPEPLISERWPKLKKRAQHETNPAKLIVVLEEIDDLLFTIEMKVAAQAGRTMSGNDMDPRPGWRESGAIVSDDLGIGSE